MQAAALLQRHPGVEDLDLSGLVYRPGLDAHFVATIAPALYRCVHALDMIWGFGWATGLWVALSCNAIACQQHTLQQLGLPQRLAGGRMLLRLANSAHACTLCPYNRLEHSSVALKCAVCLSEAMVALLACLLWLACSFSAPQQPGPLKPPIPAQGIFTMVASLRWWAMSLMLWRTYRTI